jgi:uncharacterized membrane protein YwaF
MNSSTRIGESGARPHTERAKTKPVDSKIILFVLFIQLMGCCILNSKGSLGMNVLYVNEYSMTKDV